jgi:hypothetical protein
LIDRRWSTGGHSLIQTLRDDHGVVFVCACGRWGYAGPNDGAAWTAFQGHLEETAGYGDNERNSSPT